MHRWRLPVFMEQCASSECKSTDLYIVVVMPLNVDSC
jgi:hypothetical protein